MTATRGMPCRSSLRLDCRPASLERHLAHRIILPVAELHREDAVGRQARARGLHEALDEVQSLDARVQGYGRLEADDVERQRDVGRDVRRVGDDDVDAAADRLEQVATNETDSLLETMFSDVAGGDTKRCDGDVRGDDARRWKFLRQRDGEAAAAGADIDDPAHGVAVAPQLAHGFDDELRLGARDQDVGRDDEIESPELAMPGDERDRFVRRAPFDEAGVLPLDVGRHRFLPVGDQARAVPAESMARQHLGVEAGVVRHQPGLDKDETGVSDSFVD